MRSSIDFILLSASGAFDSIIGTGVNVVFEYMLFGLEKFIMMVI